MLSEADLTNITPPRVPLIDARTGNIAREWYLFFFSQFTRSRELTSQSNTNQIDINSTNLSLSATQTALASTQSALEATDAAVAQLEQDTAGIGVAPIYTPQLPRLRYGSFYDTTDQTAGVANTAYAITYNSTDLSQGVYIGSPTSRVYVDTHNVYNIQFSAQLINVSGGAHNVWIWLRKNGTNVANTATALRVEGNNTQDVAAWNFLLEMNAGDYFELMWEVSDTSVTIQYDAASAVHPAIPSVILTVTDNISA